MDDDQKPKPLRIPGAGRQNVSFNRYAWLRERMNEMRVTQTRLSEVWETDPSTVSRWITGRATDEVLTFRRACLLAHLLDMSLVALAERFGFEATPPATATPGSTSSPPSLPPATDGEAFSVTINSDNTATVIINATIPAAAAVGVVAAMVEARKA